MADPMASDIEKLLIPQIQEAFQTAINLIVEHGYTEEAAEWAVLRSGLCVGSSDIVSNIVDGALDLLSNHGEDLGTTERGSVDSLADAALVEMVNVVREVKPHLTVAEAMWLLLISDLNLFHAQAREGDALNLSSNQEKETQNQSGSQENPLKCGCCTRLSLPEMEGTSPGEKSGAAGKGTSLYPRKDLLLQKGNKGSTALSSQSGVMKKNGKGSKAPRQDEPEKSGKAKAMPEEATRRKRISEAEAAVKKIKGQIEAADLALRKLQAKHAMLKKERADSKLKSASSFKKLQEAKVNSLQDEIEAPKGKSANLEKARKDQHEFEVLGQPEEGEKTKFVRKGKSTERERRQLVHQTKAKEDNLTSEAEANRLMFQESMNKLNVEIAALKLKREAAKGVM